MQEDNIKLDAYVECYLIEGKGSLDSYQESHKDILKVKASNFHGQPIVVKAILDRLVAMDDKEIKDLPNGRYLIQTKGRYIHLKKELGVCPVDIFEACKNSNGPTNNPCENIVILTKILAFFEFTDKDKYQSVVKDLIAKQEGVLDQFLANNFKKWNINKKKMEKKIKDFKLRPIKYY